MHGNILPGRAVELADDLVGSAVKGPAWTAEDWAAAITSTWRRAVESIIETGRLLIRAKAKLKHGQWNDVLNKLPFTPRTAQMLMQVAANPVLSNANLGSHLPASWRTLCELARLPDEALKTLIADGTVNTETTRNDVLEIAQRIRAGGFFDFRALAAAINTIAKFQQRWPDPVEIAGNMLKHAQEEDCAPHISVDDIPAAAKWLAELHAVVAAEIDRQQARDEAELADCGTAGCGRRYDEKRGRIQ